MPAPQFWCNLVSIFKGKLHHIVKIDLKVIDSQEASVTAINARRRS